jgi:septal ring factor EnvC (AmiA/AmiB activator)
MVEPTDNLILRLLQEMRTEAVARDEKTQAQIGILAQGLTGVRAELQSIRVELKELRGDMKRMNDHISELAIAVDHHTTRLDRIEQHLGLDAAKH